MFLEIIKKLITGIQNESYENKLLFLFRLISLSVTSTYYITFFPDYTLLNKLIVVFCLTVVSILSSYFYINNESSKIKLSILLAIETIGNSFILLPTGGLNSPYIWYALNTFLIAMLKLGRRHCILNLVTYLCISTIVILINNKEYSPEIKKWEFNLIVSFILITIAIMQLVKMIHKIQEEQKKQVHINRELLLSNKKSREAMEQIMALYQAVHSFTNQKNTDDLVKLLINYTKTITKAENVLFKNFMEERAGTLLSNHCIEESIKEKINQNIEEKWDNKKNNEKIYELNFGYNQYIMIEVKSTYKTYGVLGIETKVNKNNFHYTQIIDQLIFLSELSAIVLERVHLEEINERLLITQEQNRIASEIHDTVLQRLFSMSCGIFALTKNINDLENKQIIEELNQIRNTTDGIMKSLRATIYDLSWEKNSNAFLENINKYILEIEKMCNVNIKLKVNGNQHRLSARHKKAIYRIICEGIGNATRHGKSTHIDVTLKMKTNLVILEITDNGVGFDVKQIIRNSKKGLGIRNLYHLTESLNGVINLQSKIDKGTLIKIDIPLETLSVKEEAG